MRIPCLSLGHHGPQILVAVHTLEGARHLAVPRDVAEFGALEVGAPVGRGQGRLLVELPSESFEGDTRVWMAEDLVLP